MVPVAGDLIILVGSTLDLNVDMQYAVTTLLVVAALSTLLISLFCYLMV